MIDFLKLYEPILIEQINERNKRIEEAVVRIMRERFGCQDSEDIKRFASAHRCSLLYYENSEFVGLSVNNRWLYTTTGQIIGKKGKRWMIEKINTNI